jgi:EAL domain-containing protein (putative c-di-GMP-specific phosphodiesterase class I)/GGDEF domain-containing protein/sensor domain CHASE-containing protein
LAVNDDARPTSHKGPRPRRERERSWARRSPLTTFSYWVALPAVLVYVGVCVLVLTSLSLMTADLNRIDWERDRNAVAAAMDSFRQQLAHTVTDEATWTEAYLNTYVVDNLAWLDGTWGNSARSGDNFDTAIVTDVEGTILFGESRRGPLSGNISSHFSAPKELLTALDTATAPDQGTSIARFSKTVQGVSALAAAVIRTSNGQSSVPHAERRILWLARQLDPAVLKEIGTRFQIPVPRLAAQPVEGEDHLALTDAADTAIAGLAWRPLRPGDAAFTRAASVASLVLLGVGIMVFAVLVAFRRSVERRAEADEREWISARYDAGTGLLNGFGLEESLVRQIPKREGRVTVAVASIELEGLRDVIDSYGRETAEHLLDALADQIDAGTEGRAMFARMSPDALLLCRTGEDAGELVRQFSRIVIEILGEPIALGDLRLKLGCSIGVAETTCAREGIGAAIRMGASASQHARETGGNHIVEYEEAIDERRHRRLELQADIRRGLDEDEFDVEYQPIFDFSNQVLAGVEALVRWRRRADGPLSPGQFIPAAEASGLIEELGMFVLRRACRDIAQFPSLKLSVNVSTVQFRSPRLARQIDRILIANNFPPERLQLEITESFLLAQPDRARAAIEELRSRGIVIALDDFGTGFASIGYLREFQFDRVKLDRSLVDELHRDPVKAALVQSTMVFAFAMGLAVTAEGVERHEEARALTRIGCREFQGYLFSKPLPLEALHRLLRSETPPLRLAG